MSGYWRRLLLSSGSGDMRAGSGEYSQVMEFHPELRERLLWRLLLRRGAYCELLLKQAVLYDEGAVSGVSESRAGLCL